MPLVDPRPDDPELIAKFVAHGMNRACLRRPPQLFHGTPFSEVRTWCPKTRVWKVKLVVSCGDWSLVLSPIQPGFFQISN
jgi:hypothetical protein